jgi:hypothetical protein
VKQASKIRNADHPIKPMNPNKLKRRTRDPQLLFVRTPVFLGETQIEMSSRYDRPPWKPVNEKQFDVRLSAFGPETSSGNG